MAIANEITRLQTAKSDIKTAIEGKWVTVPASAKLDTYASYIGQIPSSSGGAMAYMWGILSINWDMISINSSDSWRNRYWDFTSTDWTRLYMIKPRELNDYSSSWHSYVRTKAYCMALKKWATSTINADLNLYDWWWYTSTSMHYYYIWNWKFRFYGATWEYRDTYRCKEISFNGSSRSVTNIWWDWTAPSLTWWDEWLLKTEVVGSLTGTFYFKWKPNI